MCGIIGYVGHREAAPVLLDGLHRLEYRGYDSAGVAVLDGSGLLIRKRKGKIDEGLARVVSQQPAAGYIGALASTGYLTVIKVLEVTGGLLLVSGRFVPLGITILTPVIVNILLFEVFLAHQPGFGVAMTVMALFLIAGYRRHFRPVSTRRIRSIVEGRGRILTRKTSTRLGWTSSPAHCAILASAS